ncbi:MAG TPA: carbohydrate kinase family protein [Roseiflexaceae bacterium]|nr:carbohydrate kinase family protein [Roseiflexaceae bacterium]
MTILVVGDANADLSAALGCYPAEGHDSPIEALSWGSGGAAVNVAAALASLGSHARLLARVGRDPAADVALRAARGAGVDLRAVQVDERLATGLCFAAVSPGGERTFFSFRGANTALGAPPGPETLEGVRWLHVCGHALLEGRQRDTALSLIDWTLGRGVPVSLDLCLPLIEARRAEVLDLLPALAMLFVNEPELAALAGPDVATASTGDAEDVEHGGAESLSRYLRGGGTKEAGLPAHVTGAADRLRPGIVVVKLGARGCLVIAPAGRFEVAGQAVAALDTTACGDAFAAGFIHAHLCGADPPTCAALANAMGALVATRPGGGDSIPTRAELRAFLEQRAPEMAALVPEV